MKLLPFAPLLYAIVLALTPLPAVAQDLAATAEAPPAEAAEATSPVAVAPPMLEPMDERLRFGGYGIAVGDVKETEFTSGRVGVVDGTLYLLAVQADGYIHNPAVPEQALAVPLADIRAIGLKRYGFNRQIHVDLGDRVAVFSVSGGTFIDRKATQALYDAIVAAGVPTFKPKRFVGHPYRQPITIYY